MTNKTEKQYGELRKKYRLPEFKEINYEFELSDLDETDFLIKSIVKRIAEKLDFFTGLFEDLLQPDGSNLSAMHESRVFEDDEKKEAFDLYRKLMFLSRRAVELSLNGSEKDEAEFINIFFSEWKPIKEELKKYLNKMKESWKTETDIKEDIGYLG
ncbi:MAG: hypothetical protein AABX32_00715 [Nanoarchaeota archaeon]